VDLKWVTQTWVRQGEPGRMRTLAGRSAEAAVAAAAVWSAVPDGLGEGRPPEPVGTPGAGTWHFFPDS
jgi:hypothetical protein